MCRFVTKNMETNRVQVNEEWREIPGFNGRYLVSNIGRVRNSKHFCKSEEPGIMTPFMTGRANGGYLRIALLMPTGEQRKFQVHQLVATAFIPNPDKKPHINHINCVRCDNRVENLEWCTPKENAEHKVKMGRCNPSKGESHAHAKLNDRQVIEIKRQLKEGKISMYRIAKNFGVHKVTIFDIKYNNTWKHIE